MTARSASGNKSPMPNRESAGIFGPFRSINLIGQSVVGILGRGSWPILLLLTLVSFYSPVFFAGRSLIPIGLDTVMGPRPYKYAGPLPSTPSTNDPVSSLNLDFAFDAYTARVLQGGRLPFWNPYQGLGQSYLDNETTAVFYPPNWLHLVLPPAWWDMVYLLNGLLAASFLYLYLRFIGLDEWAALIGGATFIANGLFQIYLPMRELPAVAAWFPLLLYAVERTAQEPSWRHRHWVLALSIYCTVAGGQPEVTFLSLTVVLVYGSLRLLLPGISRLSTFTSLIPGVLSGLLISAPVWLNFARYAFSITTYTNHLPGAGVGLIHQGLPGIATYFFPYLYGTLFAAVQTPGFDWNWFPGWTPAIAAFLAVAAILGLAGPLNRWPWSFFFVLLLLTIAKVWGLPIVSRVGSLPIFDRIVFPRYAAFLIAFPLAALAGAGAQLARLDSCRWWASLVSWGLLACGILVLGIGGIWPNLYPTPLGQALTEVMAFGLMGLAWAVLGPLALWLTNLRYRPDSRPFYFAAFFGILLQGEAYAPFSYKQNTFAWLSLVCLVIYLLAISFSGLVLTLSRTTLVIGGLIMVGLPPLIATLFSPSGLPRRYDPITVPPYISFLRNSLEGNRYRSCSIDGALMPNFAAPFSISNLSYIDDLTLQSTKSFMTSYIDRSSRALYFASNRSISYKRGFDPLRELTNNRRYFELVGARYLVTLDRLHLRPPLYDTEASHIEKKPVPLETPIKAVLTSPSRRISEIDVLLSTYVKKNPGSVTLRVLDSQGRELVRGLLDTAELADNRFAAFKFTPIEVVGGDPLNLELSFTPAARGSMIAAWTYTGTPQLGFALQVPDTEDDRPTVYSEQTGIQIHEQGDAAERLFLAPSADVAPSWQEALEHLRTTENLTREVWLVDGQEIVSQWPRDRLTGKLLDFHLRPNTVRARFESYTVGILTLTDSFAEGWHAILNGNEVPVLRVDGVFRGVRITQPGIYNVRFWYRPPLWNTSLWLACGGIALLLAATLLSNERVINRNQPGERPDDSHKRSSEQKF